MQETGEAFHGLGPEELDLVSFSLHDCRERGRTVAVYMSGRRHLVFSSDGNSIKAQLHESTARSAVA